MVEFFLARGFPTIKVLCFEEMLADLYPVVGEVTAFMGLEPLGEAQAKEVVRLSSKAWMAEHDEKFSEGWVYLEQLKFRRYDNPPLPPVAKVTQGPSGGGEEAGGAAAAVQSAAVPSAATVAWMQEQWTKQVFPKTGCKDYAAMRAVLAAEGAN